MVAEICEMKVGARGVIRQYIKDSELTWTRIFCELIDNSLDASATVISVVKNGDTMIVKDDGVGCPEPDNLVSLGCSYEHGDNRSGYFGLGGTVSGIRASKGTRVEYVTVCNGQRHRVVADWAQMIDRDHLFFEKSSHPATPAEKGTKITIHNCMRFKDLDKVIQDLGFRYMDALKEGLSLTFRIDGRTFRVAAYEHPSFDDEIKFQFEWDGFPVHGFCGLVNESAKNPYEGWVVHWGPHRVLTVIRHEPARGRSVRRLHGHLYLPTEWREHNMTKDGFAYSPESLYDLIAEHCERIIVAADEASTDYELNAFTEAVEIGLNESLPPRVKGHRPDSAGKNGTVDPAESDREHKEFGPHQPGDKGKPRDPTGRDEKRCPYPFKVEWREDLEGPWEVNISQSRKSPSRILLDKLNPAFRGFLERDDPEGLMVVIQLLVSHHLGRHTDQQGRLGCFEELETEVWFEKLTTSASSEWSGRLT